MFSFKTPKPMVVFRRLAAVFTFFCTLGVNAWAADNSALLSAVENGDQSAVRSILANGFDVNYNDPSTGAALHVTAKSGDSAMAEMLLDNGADVGAQKGKSLKTPLHIAAQAGHVQLIELLLKRGADVNALDKKGESPLFSAILGSQPDALKSLIDSGADLEVVSRFKDTPVYKSISLGKPEATEMLLAEGAALDLAKVVEKQCSKCHGVNGRSGAPFSPNLAGMGSQYFVAQFKDYQAGKRMHERMDARQTNAISVSVLDSLAVYYAKLPPIELESEPESMARGKALYSVTSESNRGCVGCHGVDGVAMSADLPRLANQNAEYLSIQLNAYQSGARSNDADAVMREAVVHLEQEQITDISNYLQGM